MPELPEVETTCRGLADLVGQTVQQCQINQPKLRQPVPEHLSHSLLGQKLRRIQRRGKYIIMQLDQGYLILHLGMSGHLKFSQTALEPQKHDHILWIFDRAWLIFHDPRRFGSVQWYEDLQQTPIAALGPEPLSHAFDAAYLEQQIHGRRKSIKALLMDQAIIAGIGNIYAMEALFFAGIQPQRAAATLSSAECQNLVQAIKTILQQAIAQGGTSIKDFKRTDGRLGYFVQSLQVYGRAGQPCYRCQGSLKSLKIQGRQTVYCPQCQK